MGAELSIVVGNYPHTRLLKSTGTFAGVSARFLDISPVHDAFDDMVRHQTYDVCEMAIGAFLQARQAGKPLVLLPVVMVGGFHHRSIYASPAFAGREPRELKGAKVGVRSHSQTTGLWVRGWLDEEYGVGVDDVTWVTTEGSHAEEYHDPENVVRADKPLVEALRANEIAAAILGRAAAPVDLPPLLADADDRDRAWYGRHGTAPVNHMVVVTSALVERDQAAVEEIYRSLCIGIDQAAVDRAGADQHPGALPSAVRHGRAEMDEAIRLAAEYALEQRLISKPVGDLDALFAW